MTSNLQEVAASLIPDDSRLETTDDGQWNKFWTADDRVKDERDLNPLFRRRPRRMGPSLDASFYEYAGRTPSAASGVPLVERFRLSLSSLTRVLIPAILANAIGIAYYDNISYYISSNFLDSSSIKFLSSDELQFIPSFLTVISLLFSILAGNAFSSLYQQQETIYFALYREVSEAKSLLEQMTLVCSGRPFYRDALEMLSIYVRSDLRRVDVPPAELISQSPRRDPLEAIMYLTSVGTPGVVYETVRDLRQARGYRLGAMQRKFPRLGIILLWLLAGLELLAFPLLGAGSTAVAQTEKGVLFVQAFFFGGLCGATTLVLRIIQELWRTQGGCFNVDPILDRMVAGLTEELAERAEVAADSDQDEIHVSRARTNGAQAEGPEYAAVKRLLSRVEELEARLENAEGGADKLRSDGRETKGGVFSSLWQRIR